MNYGKKSVSKKRNSLISRTAMMGKRAHVSFIRVLFISLIALCVIVGCLGIGAFRGIIDNAPDVEDVDISPLGYATFLYDGDGNQLRKLTAPSSNRLPVSIEQIPVDLQHAVVAIEDERFYEHNGIDVRGILRAFVKNYHFRRSLRGCQYHYPAASEKLMYLPTGPRNPPGWNGSHVNSRSSIWQFRLKRRSMTKT